MRLDDCEGAPLADRVADAGRVQPRPHAAAADPLDRETARTTCASGSRAAKIDPIWVIGGLELVGN